MDAGVYCGENWELGNITKHLIMIFLGVYLGNYWELPDKIDGNLPRALVISC